MFELLEDILASDSKQGPSGQLKFEYQYSGLLLTWRVPQLLQND
jgi:hypothetical protein